MNLKFWQKAMIRILADEQTLRAAEQMFSPDSERGENPSINEILIFVAFLYAAILRKSGKDPSNQEVDLSEIPTQEELSSIVTNAGMKPTFD